ncbi:MAG: isoprenylcysteine carboxylmethyltransferase family protein [Candidatus Liptonbacteria bacterium]|nr:isoprenylcysteine carboxylmethyltransferase family protein [Candidatus Liptonbacteria bacterium]
MKYLYNLIPLGAFFASLALEVILDRREPLYEWLLYPYTLLGLAPMAIGLYFLIAFFRLFEKHKTTVYPGGMPTHLVREGPYRVSRNPVYLGYLLMLLGASATMGSFSSFLPLILFYAVLDRVVIPFEEKRLRERFGAAYEEYARTVRRWI